METKVLLVKEEKLIEIANEVARSVDASTIVFVSSDRPRCDVKIASFGLMEVAKINYKQKFIKSASRYKLIAEVVRHYSRFTKMSKDLKRSIIIKHLEA